MSDKKVKEIKRVEEAEDDQAIFLMQYTEDMKQVILSVVAKEAITPEQYMQLLSDFVNEMSEFPEKLFVEDYCIDDKGLH